MILLGKSRPTGSQLNSDHGGPQMLVPCCPAAGPRRGCYADPRHRLDQVTLDGEGVRIRLLRTRDLNPAAPTPTPTARGLKIAFESHWLSTSIRGFRPGIGTRTGS